MDEYIHEYEYSLVPKFDPDEYDPEEDGYFEFLPEDTMYSKNSFVFVKYDIMILACVCFSVCNLIIL